MRVFALVVVCVCLVAPARSSADSSPAVTSAEADDDDMVIADASSEGAAKTGRRKRRTKSAERDDKQKPKRETGNRKRSKKDTKKDGRRKGGGEKPAALEVEGETQLSEAKQMHARLLVMVYADMDPNSHMALPRFRRLAQQWGAPGNVTLATAEAQAVPETAELLGLEHAGSIEKLPLYGLFLRGIERPVLYQGGWSRQSIGAWLHHQTDLQPTVLRSPQHLDELIAHRAAKDNGYGLVTVGLFDPEHMPTFELAARSARAYMSVATGGERMANLLGAPFPCVLVAWKDTEMPWALLTDTAEALTQERVVSFIATRALPPRVVPLGYTYNDRFADQVFKSRSRRGDDRLLVMLFHRLKKQPKTEVNRESAVAIQVMREVAPAFAGVALFAAHDFFDNDPTSVEEYYEIKESRLPTVVVLQEGGASWHLQGPVKRRSVENLIERVLRESKLSREPPADWQTLSRPRLTSRDEL
jgi:hypothetical protein